MKKLLLASYSFKTGDETFHQARLVMVESSSTQSDDQDCGMCNDAILEWFPKEYPESELLTVITRPTITAGSPADPDTEMYSRSQLVAFGNAMVKKGHGHQAEWAPEVTHADVENFRTGEGII